jgi:hypothetical protein
MRPIPAGPSDKQGAKAVSRVSLKEVENVDKKTLDTE